MSQIANSRMWYRYVFTYADGRRRFSFPCETVKSLTNSISVPRDAASVKIEICDPIWSKYADQPDPANS